MISSTLIGFINKLSLGTNSDNFFIIFKMSIAKLRSTNFSGTTFMGLSKFAAIELKHEIESTGLIGQITFDFSASLIVSSNVLGGLSIKSSL